MAVAASGPQTKLISTSAQQIVLLVTNSTRHLSYFALVSMSETSSASEEDIVASEAVEEEAEEEEDEDDQSIQTELDAWRQVHDHLSRAVAVAEEAVAAKKLQRRFWLEEICSNLTEEGKLTSTSVWKRPVQPKKTAAKKAAKPKDGPTKKRKRKSDPKPKKTKKKKEEEEEEDGDDEEQQPKSKMRVKLKAPSAKRSSPPLAAVAAEVHDPDETTEEEEDESEPETGANADYRDDMHAAMHHEHEYHGGHHAWGSGQHGYMVRKSTIRKCTSSSQYLAYFGLIVFLLSFSNQPTRVLLHQDMVVVIRLSTHLMGLACMASTQVFTLAGCKLGHQTKGCTQRFLDLQPVALEESVAREPRRRKITTSR